VEALALCASNKQPIALGSGNSSSAWDLANSFQEGANPDWPSLAPTRYVCALICSDRKCARSGFNKLATQRHLGATFVLLVVAALPQPPPPPPRSRDWLPPAPKRKSTGAQGTELAKCDSFYVAPIGSVSATFLAHSTLLGPLEASVCSFSGATILR